MTLSNTSQHTLLLSLSLYTYGELLQKPRSSLFSSSFISCSNWKLEAAMHQKAWWNPNDLHQYSHHHFHATNTSYSVSALLYTCLLLLLPLLLLQSHTAGSHKRNNNNSNSTTTTNELRQVRQEQHSVSSVHTMMTTSEALPKNHCLKTMSQILQ